MGFTTFATFVLIGAAQVASPGPSTVFLLNNAIMYGPRRAILVLSGDLVAIVILASLSAAGVGALLATNVTLFTALRLGGAVYPLWLGLRYFRAPSVVVEDGDGDGMPAGQDGGSLGLWLQSFGIGISNPKAILFFAALFPQFVPADGGPGLLAVLVGTFVATKLFVLAGFAFGARQLRSLFSGQDNGALGRRLTGALFIMFGLGMIWPILA
ncbi:LysE family translocator [Roseomonas marmotae]|uniref:LysE family translocator n=1 Tax=Roseomonas marmotae TaxID=2768161 RepID=A0ABS3KLZ9_9PROT|nr:LysE family translocator [Roseomonas marmotae]MBO1077331.1 LysE family translocator [Roseomonas marmotae]QTI81152.1 LysE family translocator [Roseomonas marmotae]